MPVFDVTQPTPSDTAEWTPLATGQYLMEITGAKIELSPFENDQGEHDEQLRIVWKLAEWNDEYQAAGYEQGQRVYQQMRPWYGTGKRGDSKFKQFVDPLIAEGLIPPQFHIADTENADNQGDLIGITRRVMVECYKKTMGQNKGQDGNRVLAVVKPGTPRANGHPPTRPVPPPTPSAPAQDLPLAGHNDPGLSLGERVTYAQEMAKKAGEPFTTKPWDRMDEKELIKETKRMERYIEAMTDDPNDTLF